MLLFARIPGSRPRGDLAVGAGRLFFTTEERESEVWVADLIR